MIWLILLAALDEERTSPTQTSGGGGSATGNSGSNSSGTSNNNSSSTAIGGGAGGSGGAGGDAEKGEALTSKQRYQIKHRELFLSRQVESIPATQIRGKCSVTLLNETESLQSYLNKDVRSMFLKKECSIWVEIGLGRFHSIQF